jgi:predicted PurR-regulated permease PerM
MSALTAGVAAVAAAYFATPVALPFVVALFMAILVQPVAAWLTRRGLPRVPAALTAVALALAATLLFGWACWSATAGVIENVPQYSGKIREAAGKVQGRVRHLQKRTQTLVPRESGRSSQAKAAPAQGGSSDWTGALLRGIGSIAEAIGLAVFVPFLAMLLIIEREPLERALDRAAGRGFDAQRLRAEAPPMVRAFILGNLLVGLALSGIQAAIFLAIGLENAVGLGIVTGFLNVIPVLGLPAALVLPIAQGLGSFHGVWPYVVIAATLGVLHLGVANWVLPRTIGARVKVNGTAGTLGMLFFGWMWGVVGFLLAVPLTALLKIALECSSAGESWAGLLAVEPRQGASRTK